jgi:spermidine synthase
MNARFEELDWRETPMGEISLRRRREPTLDVDVFEVRLGEEYLMSSLFTVAEIELARLGLAAVPGEGLDVLVGGLGLGYTAVAALEDPRVGALTVVEALPEVVDWHRRGLLPVSSALTSDARTRLVTADFFTTVGAGRPVEDDDPDRTYDALLVDIDHSPRHVLHLSHAVFYSAAALRRMRRRLRPGGVFALWSDDPPDDDFVGLLEAEFSGVASHVVRFDNFLTGGTSANTVYVATTG